METGAVMVSGLWQQATRGITYAPPLSANRPFKTARLYDRLPEINAMIFRSVMSRSAGERVAMGFDMTATAKALVWASLPEGLSEAERRVAFYERFYGEPCPLK